VTKLPSVVRGLAGLLAAACLAGSDGATVAQHELTLAPVLPGAVEVFSSPEPALNDRFLDMVVDVNRWWTAPGTVDQAVAYLRTHAPAGMVAQGLGRRSGGGLTPLQWVSYGGAGYPYSLDVYVAALGDGVGLRANIQDTGKYNGPSVVTR
jgi:hypothetical protein